MFNVEDLKCALMSGNYTDVRLVKDYNGNPKIELKVNDASVSVNSDGYVFLNITAKVEPKVVHEIELLALDNALQECQKRNDELQGRKEALIDILQNEL